MNGCYMSRSQINFSQKISPRVNDSMQLNKAVALITGGAQGFGRAFAETLLRRGANVVIADIDAELGESFQEEVTTQYNGEKKLHFLKCDVSDGNQLSKTFEQAKECFGKLNIICNNAGIVSGKPELSRKQIDINLTAVVEGTYKGVELMSTQNGGEGGVIVNVASAAGLDLMGPAAVYSATKHAVVAFSRSFNFLPYYVNDNVRVNCICPFFADTKLVRDGLKENPVFGKVVKRIGMIKIEDVTKGFMQCVEDEELNAKVVVISPPDRIFEMKFPRPKL